MYFRGILIKSQSLLGIHLRKNYLPVLLTMEKLFIG